MKFQKGKSGNPSGRPPGVKNKTSEQIRKIIRGVLSEYLDEEVLLADLQKLDSTQRITAIDRLLKHVLPPPAMDYLRLSEEDFKRLVNELKKQTINN